MAERHPAVVVDTNVFVAAGFNPRSASARVVAAVRQGKLRMIWNVATRSETRRVLRTIPPLSWESVADLFRDEDCHTAPTDPRRVEHIRDPADRKFAALARATGALLISQDEDLLTEPQRMDVLVLSPREFAAGSWMPR